MFSIINKVGSIIDYQKEELPPNIFKEGELISSVRDFIYNQTISFFERRNIKRYQGFIVDCYIASSLASYNYKDDTDLDIKFVIDIPLFKKYNPTFEDKSYEEICDYLIDVARDSKELTDYVPGTEHPLDPYFYDEHEGVEETLIKYDSLYSIGANKWIKQPTKLPKDLDADFFIKKAKEYAEPYLNKVIADIQRLRNNSIDFMILKDYLAKIDDISLKEIKYYYEQQLSLIDKDLDELEEDRDLIKQLRSSNFDRKELKTEIEKLGGSLNYGKGNLIFKIMQRYGYMNILNELSSIFKDREFTIDDLPILMTIIN